MATQPRRPIIALRNRASFLKLGRAAPSSPVVLDTNVFINGLAGRGPTVLRELLEAIPRMFVAAPTRAELSWVLGRLDPEHPGTRRALGVYQDLLERIMSPQVLVPTDADWMAAGTLAGTAARVLASGGRSITAAFDRVELISDSLTAVLARREELAIVTEDADFDLLAQLVPGLRVLFYDRAG